MSETLSAKEVNYSADCNRFHMPGQKIVYGIPSRGLKGFIPYTDFFYRKSEENTTINQRCGILSFSFCSDKYTKIRTRNNKTPY